MLRRGIKMLANASSKAIRFTTTTRGNGKVFTLINTNLDAPRWTATSTTKDGQPVPAKVHPLPDGRQVLVVPAITANQKVVVTAYDDKGMAVAQAKHRVDAKIAKLRSQVNTALHNHKIDGIRNCDGGVVPTQIHISVRRLVPHPGVDDILHFRAFFPTYDQSKGYLPVTPQALDINGNALPASNFTLLGDLIEEYPRYPGVYYRMVSYSLHVPLGTDWLYVGASCPESGIDQGFTCLQPHEHEFFSTNWRVTLYGFEGRDPNYEVWFKDQRITEKELALQARTQKLFATRPKFSIVVPLYHTPADLFNEMAASVIDQSYPNFELILVNSTPQDAELAQAVEALAQKDDRVRVVTLDKNYGITENTNVGVAAATGDFVCFLDHDDLLELDLLYWYVKAINDYPTTDLLYCNEDKILDGHYVEPFYKPDWSPALLESSNYVCHLLCVRKSIIDQLPTQTARFDGAQDHNLTLAASELVRNVYHVPKVLYHWRIREGSTAADVNAKPESFDAGILAINEHFARLGIDAKATNIPDAPHMYLPVYNITERPAVSAIVGPGESDKEVARTVQSLEHLGWDGLQVITSGTTSNAEDVARLMADAANKATGEYLVFITAGTTFDDTNSFEQLVAVAQRPGVGIVAPKVVLPDETTYSNGMAFYNFNMHILHRYYHRHTVTDYGLTVEPHELSITNSECLVLARSTYDQIGGIPVDAPPRLWGVALCLAARHQGLRVVQYSPAYVTRLFDYHDLTLNIRRLALEDASDRTYLLANYPSDVLLFDHYYKPQF